MLEACHIVDWAKDDKNRVNPRNGLCLNLFFHKAYDANLIGISPDMKIVISDELLLNICENTFCDYIKGVNGRTIILPDKFLPEKIFWRIVLICLKRINMLNKVAKRYIYIVVK